MAIYKFLRYLLAVLLAGAALFGIMIGYRFIVSQFAVTSFNRPTIVRLPIATSKEAVVFEFYDRDRPEDQILERQLDELAEEFRTYDGRLKIYSTDAYFEKYTKEFGITELPSVLYTNRRRDFKVVYSGKDIPSRLRNILVSTGYEKTAKSGFG